MLYLLSVAFACEDERELDQLLSLQSEHHWSLVY